MRPTRLISCVAIVGTLVVAAVPASASAAGPSVGATPNKKLADGQVIMVSASGFAADTSMAVVECPTATVTPSACDLSTVNFTFTDATGAYSDFPFTVSRILGDGTDCALVGGCYIGTQDDQGLGPTAATLIKFDPSIPPFTISVRFDKTPSVNSKGVVALNGRVGCNNGSSDVEVDVDLRQIVDRAIFESFGYAVVSCSSGTAPFRMTIRPQNGLFGPGSATVRFQAFAGNRFLARRVGVDLQAKAAAQEQRAWR